MLSPSVASTKTSSTTQAIASSKPTIRKPSRKGFFLNFVAGGIAGTTGVIVTCPLDVVQTRLQSSYVKLQPALVSAGNAGVAAAQPSSPRFGLFVYSYMRHIVKSEGFFSLYKGLIPNLLGIAPSRAIYFAVYTKTKGHLTTTHLSNSSATHMLSALCASWTVSTMTNPIWFLKTKMQLDLSVKGHRRSLLSVVKEVFKNEGVFGFYRGLFASYIGASETMIYFVLYERLKMMMGTNLEEKEKLSAIDYVCSAFVAKSAATIAVYPHEVVRTRLREESVKNAKDKLYKGFFQTIQKVYKDEGRAGLYGGMGAHLMRQVPNTVIMFLTYESIVNFLARDD